MYYYLKLLCIVIIALFALNSLTLGSAHSNQKAFSDATIRVKIFPHKRDYAPHFKDPVTNRIRIESSGLCTLSTFDLAGQPLNTLKAQTFYLNAQNALYDFAYLECSEPFTLVRLQKAQQLFTSKVQSAAAHYPPSFTYHGALHIYKEAQGHGGDQFVAINEVNIQEYLKGVVPSEVVASWPAESLKTQAVAARTYAAFHINKNLDQPYHVDDTIFYQVYTGINHQHPATNLAIEETKGEVLFYRGEIIEAFYHANSGGHTSDPLQVFYQDVPYCKGKPEPFLANIHKVSHWTFHVKEDLLVDILNRNLDLNLKKIHRLRIIKYPQTAITKSVVLEGRSQAGKTVVHNIKGRTLKSILNLQSYVFNLKIAKNKQITISGKGNGHGVCLNQTGAYILASQKKWDYRKILHFYYSGIEIKSHSFSI